MGYYTELFFAAEVDLEAAHAIQEFLDLTHREAVLRGRLSSCVYKRPSTVYIGLVGTTEPDLQPKE